MVAAVIAAAAAVIIVAKEKGEVKLEGQEVDVGVAGKG